ncbi:MAG: aldo/keto reductase [Bryobacterales bacterium]|nr:aldo/keto reductase [Bryobacterales bacterium]
MQTIPLPRTELTVSRLAFGNMTFGGQTMEEEAARILDTCLERGITFLDTANVYNAGKAEEMLGSLLAGRRQDVVLASKVRGKMGDGPLESGLSRAAILHNAEQSLRRLRTDYLDLYYMHMPDNSVALEESLEAMDTLVRQGKVLYPALSNYAAWQTLEAFRITGEQGYAPVAAAQMMYNVVARGLEQEFVPMASKYELALVAYNPLAGGLLTGKQQRERPAPGTRFDGNRMYMDRYWHPAYFDAVDELRALAGEAGRSLISLSLNWLLHHTSTACVLLGASRLDQLTANLDAAEEGPLSEEVVKRCDEIWLRVRGPQPKYNR